MILVDPGPSQKAGKALQAVLGGMSGLPVVAIVLTHAHPENTLATGALSGPGVPVIASDLAAGLMYERCPRCLARLQRSVGASGMKGTRIILPNHTVAQSDTRVIGGRSMRLLRFEHAHTRGDLAVLDEETRVLFAGGLAVAEVIPDLGEGSLAGWRQALTELIALRPRMTIPGQGTLAAADPLGATLAYLDSVAAFVTRELVVGSDLAGALDRASMPAFGGWSGYPRRHLLNVQRAWQEMEGEFFFGKND
ncbi:MAG: MBL fold metallo-hydrolase [Rhodocyclaceae bacterium]|nr:MBL fold metallo-hydrolase [Rhodocyclaceae bacterium]